MTEAGTGLRVLVPGAYWLGRYARAGAVAFGVRLLLIDGVSLALILSWPAAPEPGRMALAWVVARAAYLCLYETGYFVNDFWSARREGKTVEVPPAALLAAGVLLRLLASAGLLVVLGSVWPPLLGWTLGMAGVGLGIFAVHNALFFPARIPTFALLYLVRYALAVPLLTPEALPTAALAWMALAAAFAVKYRADRRTDHPTWGVWNRTRVTLVFRVAALALALAAAGGWLAGGVRPGALVLLALALLALDGIYSVLQVGRALRDAFRRERVEVRHMHTRLSHDATLELEELAAFLRQTGRRRLLLSEHAEDVGPDELEELRAGAERSGEDIRVGVEVTVLNQHVLLEEIEAWDGPQRRAWSVEELRARRPHYARAIWAHPHFSIRGVLFDAGYRRGLVALARAVDGVEVLNRKSDRSWNHVWRGLLVGALAVMDRACILTVGLDAHHPADLATAPGGGAP